MINIITMSIMYITESVRDREAKRQTESRRVTNGSATISIEMQHENMRNFT